MNGVNRLLWAVLVLMVASLALLAIQTFGPKPVCHAKAEDAVITDCDYHNGAWWTK